MKKPVAGCYGRLTRWKGEGCCLHGSAVVSGLRSGSGPDQSSPFLGPSTFLTTSLLFANPSTITASPCSNAASGPASSKASIAARNSGERSLFNGAAALAGIAVAGLLLKHGPNSEVADCHQRIDGVPGRKTRLAEEAKLRVGRFHLRCARSRAGMDARAIAVGEQRLPEAAGIPDQK